MATKKNATCVICGKHYSIMEGFYLRSLGADLVEQMLNHPLLFV